MIQREKVTRTPLLWPAVAMTLGIVFGRYSGADWRAVSIAAALVFVGRILLKRDWLALGFWFFVGTSLLGFRMDARSPNDLRKIFGAEAELVTIRGTISVEPERRVLEQDHRAKHRTTARVAVSEIQKRGEWQAASGNLAVSTPGFLGEEFVAGSQVEIFGVLAPPQGTQAPGLFDFEQYLRWQRTFFVLRAEQTNDWKLVRPASGWSFAALYRTFNSWARSTLQRGLPEDQNTRLLWAMTLGWKPGLTNEISEPFMRTGTLHVFAISGLHIAMIAVMLAKFLQWCGVNRSLAAALVLPLIWFYTAATGFQASAIRSTIMCSVVMIGWILKRPNNLLNSLAVSAILIFLWQAEQLFQAGFQLSFVLLLVIALWPSDPFPNPGAHLRAAEKKDFERPIRSSKWSRFIAWLFERWTGRDPLLPSDLRPFTRRMMDPFAGWTLNGLHISIASALGSLPVIAWYFNLISISSVVANLVIVPLSGVALGASLVSLGGAFIPFVSIAANGISWMTMDLMVRFCQWLEGFRWTYTYVESPGWLFIVGYYVCFLAITQGWLRERIVKVAVAGVIVIVCANSYWIENRQSRVTMLPGSGVIFVDAPWNKNDFLIDCGRDREAGAIVQPFLRAQGVDQLEAIVLTHGDVAHVEGYERLAREFRVKKTFTSAARSRSPKYREILRWLEGSHGWKKVSAGNEIAGWKVLHPPIGQDYSRADDEAIVLQKNGALLISELGRDGQRTLAALGTSLKSDVVFCGVASDGTSLREELLELIKPAVIALGGNEPKVARAAEALRRRGATVRTTMEERAIVFEQGRVKGMLAD